RPRDRPCVGALSCTMTVFPSRVSPRPRKVSRTRWVHPIGLRRSVTLSMRDSVIVLSADLFDRLAAQRGDVLGHAQIAERLHRGLDHVVWVIGADAFGEHIAHAGELDHRAHAAPGDHAGAVRGWTQQHMAGAEAPVHFKRDGPIHDRYREERLLGALDRLADGFGDLVRLAQAETDTTTAIANNHQRTEAEAPPALDHLGHSVDLNDLLLELHAAVGLDTASPSANCHT